jgi:hypothetical protein
VQLNHCDFRSPTASTGKTDAHRTVGLVRSARSEKEDHRVLSVEEVKLVRGSVRGIAQAVDELTRSAVADPERESSKAQRHAVSEMNLPSFDGIQKVVQEANVSGMLTVSSGTDHVLAFCSCLESGTGTVALGTLVRAAVEAFAKANYLWSSPTTADLIGRHIALTKDELRFPLRYSSFRQWDGTITDGKGYPAVHEAINDQLGLSAVQLPSAQTRVSELLSAGSDGQSVGGEIYSGLSGAAHAGTSALGMYLLSDGSVRYEYPSAIAFEQTGYLFAAIAVVGELVADVFMVDPSEFKTWRDKRQLAEESLIRLMAAAEAQAETGSDGVK